MSHKNPESFLIARGLPGDTPWIITHVAGTDYHDWAGMRHSRRFTKLLPRIGDPLQLTRKPWNPYDENAIEVRWADGQYMLGFIGRHRAVDLAPALDRGGHLNAFLWEQDSGSYNALAILVAGDIPEDLHAAFHASRNFRLEREAEEAWREIDPEVRRLRALWHEFRNLERARIGRRRDAIAAFATMALDPGSPAPKPARPKPPLREKYKAKERRPDGLLTAVEWETLGYYVDNYQAKKAAARLASGRYSIALWTPDQVSPIPDWAERRAATYLAGPQVIRDLNAGIAPSVTLTLQGRERCPNRDEQEATEDLFAQRHAIEPWQVALATSRDG